MAICYYNLLMLLEFDDAKNAKNVVERDLSFEQANEFDFSTAIVATDDCISERHSSVACRTLRHESFSKRIDDVTTADAALIVARSLVAQALSDNSHVASIAIFFRGVVGSTTSRSVQQRAGAALRYSHRRDQDVS